MMDDRIATDEPTTSSHHTPKIRSGACEVQSSATSPKARRSKAKVSDKPQAKKPRRNNRSARPCHFMRLPPELRLNIYEYHFRNTLENIEYKLKQRKRGGVLVRTVKDFTMIKKALSLLHTNHIMRVEALPRCIQVANTFRESMEAELDGLDPKWMKPPFTLLDDFARYLDVDDLPSELEDPRRDKLKEHRIDVRKIRLTLQLVEWNVSEKDGGLGGEKGRVKQR